MLIARIIKTGSGPYKALDKAFSLLDEFIKYKPELFFGFWCIMLAGSNVARESIDRWFYWDFGAFPASQAVVFTVVTVILWMLSRLSIIPSKIENLKSGLIVSFLGFVLFTIGTLNIGFKFSNYIPGIVYLILFLAVWIVYSIPINVADNGNKSVPGKKDQFIYLSIAFLFTTAAMISGYLLDDPIVSTAAVIYLPFLLVSLVFPAHIRHIQRARLYGIFIPAMLLATRFPWFLLPLSITFWGLRYYYYFRRGIIHPTFKIDFDAKQD